MSNNQKFVSKWAADFAGIFIGVQILTKAIDKLPYFSHYPLHVGFLFAAGIFVTIGSVFHHKLEKRVKHVHALFHLIEGAVLAVTALLLFEKGKFRLPAFIFIIGCFYIVLGVAGYKFQKGYNKRLGNLLLRWMGFAFILFGLIAIVWNWNYDQDPWVFGVAVLCVLIGAFYFLFTNWILLRIEKLNSFTEKADIK